MTKEETLKLATDLFDCSTRMKGISLSASTILLEMSSGILEQLEKGMLPEHVKEEIEEIKSELLDD